MKWTVDRIEGEHAVICIGEATFDVPLALLPADVVEGSVLALTVDREGTQAAHAAAKARIQALAQDDDGQDFSL